MEKEEKTENRRMKQKKVIKGTMISLCALIIVYFCMAAYFKNHFYFGTKINSISVSGKTVDQVKQQMESQMKSYKLTLKERDGKSEQIAVDDIKLKYKSMDDFKKLKDKQGACNWLLGFLNEKNSKMSAAVSYDDELLKEKVDNLACLDDRNIIEPKNPSFKYSNKGYIVVKEVKGNKVNKSALYDNIVKSIRNGRTKVDLEAANCYVNPKYTVKSKKTTEVKNTLNKYVSAKITYTFGDSKETVDGSTINKWLRVNHNFEIVFDRDKIKEYIHTLCWKYNTIDSTRSFVTTLGQTIKVGPGDYGWYISTAKEIPSLISDVKKGQNIKKEPAYIQTAACHGKNDIGNTYVEVNMTEQHLWFYKNGSLVTQGDVVTGNISNNTSTPEGVYKVEYKQRNATLSGQGYDSPVDFWMPFNGNIGVHDATWRDAFGGDIYKTKGSHGCVNAPYELARTIYKNIEPGTPVVCYY